MNRFARFMPAIIPIVALISAGGYLVWAYAGGVDGFPLDSAWLRLTYARNLAETGRLAYPPGQPGTGAAAPAWSYLLSVSYLIGLDPQVWAFLLGGLSLAASAWLVYRLSLRLPALTLAAPADPEQAFGAGSGRDARLVAAGLAGIFCAAEWHLVWAALSGMETILFIALSMGLIEYLFIHIDIREGGEGPASLRTERSIVSAVGIGLLGGALTLVRPEGLGLVVLVLAGLSLLPKPPARGEFRSRLVIVAVALVGCGLLVGHSIASNLRTSGSLFPTTPYARQIAYTLNLPWWQRFWQVLSPPLAGAQVLLVPGFAYAAIRTLRQRQWLAILPLIWWLGLLLFYALCLPPDCEYNHCAIPTIPILILFGVWGTYLLLRPHAPQPLIRVISRAMPAVVALATLGFWVFGAQTYRDAVGFVQSEMVATAQWLRENTDPADVLAVQDTGAIGYFSGRDLLDLTGIISSEAIHSTTDAERLLDWMLDQKADYVAYFSDFSPAFAQLAADPRLEMLFCTGYAWTREQGRENLCTYRLRASEQP